MSGAGPGYGPTDRGIALRIWPLLGAAALGLVPFTVYSNFLVDITRDSGASSALMGWLRGTGGVAALAVGLCCAPLLDRMSRRAAAAAALAVIGAACALGVLGTVWSWAGFCLLVGAGTTVLNPAVSAMAADRFRDPATSGRAATQVSATMTLTAVLAAPLLAGPALLWGWRGDLAATAVLAVAVAVLLGRRDDGGLRHRGPAAPGTGSGQHALSGPGPETPGPGRARATASGTEVVGSVSPGANRRPLSTPSPDAVPIGYAGALRVALGLPGVPGMLLVSVLRTTAFMGQLAYLAVLYSDRFQVGPGIFSLVWALSGITFFLGNWFGGRLLRSLTHSRHTAWTAAFAVLVGAAAVLVLFATSRLATALAATAALGAAHAVTAAAVTTLLVRGSEGHRGTVLALNGAGQSLGVCMGASVAGAGRALGGWTGAGVGLALVTVLAAVVAAHVAFSLRGRTDGAGRGKVVS